ncbi:DNA-binding NarL/FixJ family response regulator [Actinoplanes octamycinicus]|uniref:DNA-binding NarL/FixJ family response regulator n=1 Tax=Actinoplanes octamycinicus TaxID=135948 RepID=A0A7W7M9H3_9ACTN|nr:response regulator transcription factor [Actinoplanes octamycinicus]MBB4741856.1 DNA-binding NarL/FixJ family response regulator [Actinoplanes octamycinicus]GIE60620.1 DNA-binding response regulator [Actinoplanes octamycinicus]
MIHIVLADDERLIRAGWRTILSAHDDIEVVGDAADGHEAVVAGAGADVVLMDVRMPGMDGLTATRELARRAPATRVVVVTTFENDQLVWGALRAGAAGYVLKRAPAAELLAAVRLVHTRDAVVFPDSLRRIAAPHTGTRSRTTIELTPRESEVLRQITRGRTNSEIATALHITRETVKTHVGNVLDKLGARDRTQAAVLAYEFGLIFPGVGG